MQNIVEDVDQSTLDLLNSYTPIRATHWDNIVDPYTLTPAAAATTKPTKKVAFVPSVSGATGTKKPTLASHTRASAAKIAAKKENAPPPPPPATTTTKPRAVSATTRPPLVKSTKPLTRPCFELPGEAVSRRLREERQARLRRDEEAAEARREFWARPVRLSKRPAPVVKATVTSKARESTLPRRLASLEVVPSTRPPWRV